MNSHRMMVFNGLVMVAVGSVLVGQDKWVGLILIGLGALAVALLVGVDERG